MQDSVSVRAFFLTVDGSETHYSYVLITRPEGLTCLLEEACVQNQQPNRHDCRRCVSVPLLV